MKDLYSKWGNYIPQDIRKDFENEWLEAEQQIKELKELLKNIGLCLEDHTESIKQALK